MVMKMIKVYVTSAFSKNNAGGNRAGVVIGHPELTQIEKKAISKKLNYSETAFITDSNCADYKIEYFTPTEEVPLCGHATIASFVTMQILGLLKEKFFTIETKAGIMEIRLDEDGMVMMQQNIPQYFEYVEKKDVATFLKEEHVCENAPIQIISTGLKDVILPIKGVDSLAELKPDFEALTEFSREKEVVGVHAFAIPDDTTTIDAICRNFAPLYGIDEESATGTASCALACYLFLHHEKKEAYIFEQGYSLNLPSRIVVWVEHKGDTIQKVYVGGYGYLVEELNL